MSMRIADRATPLVLALFASGLLLMGAGLAARSDDLGSAFILATGAAAAAACLVVVPRIDPALPFTVALVLSVFSGNWGEMGIPLGLDRPLMFLAIAAVVVRALPDARRRQSPVVRPIHLLLAVLAAYALASAAMAGTLTQREPLFALIDKFGLLSFALFFLAPMVFGEAGARDLLLAGLTGLAAYLGLTALFEGLDLNALVFPAYIADPSVGLHVDRARGPFVEAAANGLALYMCGVAATIGLFTWRRPLVRVAVGCVVVLCALGIILTLTRQIWLGSGVATLVALLAAARLRKYAVPALVLGTVGVLCAFAVVPGLRDQAGDRAGSERPVWDRLNSNRAAVAMALDRPLVGFGWYRWRDESRAYYTQAADYPVTTVDRPHNVLLSNAVELGMPATALWLLALLIAVGGAVVSRVPPDLEPWRIGLIAIFINWLVVSNFTPLAYAFPNYLLWLWAGVVMAGSLRPGVFARVAPRPHGLA